MASSKPKKQPEDHKQPAQKGRLSIHDLERAASTQPFEFDAGEHGVISFPDPRDLEWTAAEELMSMFDEGDTLPSTIFRAWLSEPDFAALQACGIGFTGLVDLMSHLQDYYSEVFGTAGE